MSYFDDNDDSPAVVLWCERVDSYMDGQEGVEALRRRIQPNPPWPEADTTPCSATSSPGPWRSTKSKARRRRSHGLPSTPGSSPPSTTEPT